MSDVQIDAPAVGVAAGNLIQVRALPATVSLVGASLGDVEADLQRKDSGGNWQDVYEDGAKVTFSATRTAEAIWAAGDYRLNYTTRTNSVGCSVMGGELG